MEEIIRFYRMQEAGGILMTLVGVVALIYTVLAVYNRRSKLYQGTAWPAAVLGLLQLGRGWYLFRQSPIRQQDIVFTYSQSVREFLSKESSHINHVMQWSEIRMGIYIVLFIAAIILLWRWWAKRPFYSGLVLASAVQVVLLFVMDALEYFRSAEYLEFIQLHFSSV